MDQTTFGDEPPPNHEITRKVSSLNEDHPRVEIPPGRHWIRRQWERFFPEMAQKLALARDPGSDRSPGFHHSLEPHHQSPLRHWQGPLQKDV